MDKQKLKTMIDRPRKVALYMSLEHDGCELLFEVRYTKFDEHYSRLPDGQEREQQVDGYVRVTEPIDLLFRAVDDDSITRNAVASLDEQERKVYEELNRKIASIRELKNQLLALTHQVEELES